MAGTTRRLWTIGGLGRDDAGWSIVNKLEITDVEFAELEHKVSFVLGLASQSDYGRLLSAARRFVALLETAQRELETDGQLSPRSAAALPLDFLAVTEAARQLETALARKIEETEELPQHLVRTFHEVRHGIRASNSYLVAYEMADCTSQLSLVVHDGAVHFEGRPRHSAYQVTSGLLGLLFSLVGAYLNALYDRFDAVAKDLERHASAVTDGSPCLISYGTGTSGREQVRLRNIPVGEIAALRRFYVEGSAAQKPEEYVQAALALADATLQTDLQVGDIDLAAGLVDGDAAEGINELPKARFEVDLRVLGSTPLDYWGPVKYRVAHGGYERELFAGAVQSVSVRDDRLVLDCEGAADFTERASGGTLTSGLSQTELMRSLLLVADLPADILSLEELTPEQGEEEFEVLLPIRGLKVQEPVAVGGVEIVPTGYGETALEGLEHEGEIASRLRTTFADADSYGRASVTDTTLPGAEEKGVSAVEAAVAWLVTRDRYGFARLPDGRAQLFMRQQSLRGPRTGSVVLVRGVVTSRRWLRSRPTEDEPITRTLEPDATLLDPPLPANLSAEERHALLALRRATSEAILESQLGALWEAIEFYASGTSVEPLFTSSELKLLRKSPPEWLNADQEQRFMALIARLNDPPLGIRLKLRLKQDGVPLSEPERELLFNTLRKARNKPTHGTVPNPPTREEIHRGISIVARMLVFRIARRGNSESQD